jgi:hypothetical protein
MLDCVEVSALELRVGDGAPEYEENLELKFDIHEGRRGGCFGERLAFGLT